MKDFFLKIIISFSLIYFPAIDFAQAPNLGSVSKFALFSSAGAIANTGESHITGNIGSQAGAITSFGNVDGVMHTPDAVTLLAAADLLAAYNQLNAAIPTGYPAAVLGNGATFTAGVYAINEAGSLINTLNLDAGGDSNAVFIFQIQGAFAAAASSQVNLINGAMACNVFWKVEGAASMAAGTKMKGNVIGNNGAVSLGAGVTLEGRALSTAGAIAVNNVLVYTPLGCGTPVLKGPSLPMLSSTGCYGLFSSAGNVSNSGNSFINHDVGSNAGTTSGFDAANVTGTIHVTPDASTTAAAGDLQVVYNYLDTLSYDIELLFPAQFGNNLVITPHTYRMNGATTLSNKVILNAQGNPDAVFVIAINGNFLVGAAASVMLINGAKATNVFWKISGSITISDNSEFKGTIVGNNLITLNAGTTLEGRALTTNGNITSSSITIISASAVTIAYNTSPYCSNAGSASATVTGSSGGIFTSTPGLSIDSASGTVNLSASIAGSYIVTYTVTVPGGCQGEQATSDVVIFAAPHGVIVYNGNPYCAGGGTATPMLSGTTGGTYSAGPGLNINTTTGVVTLSTSTIGHYTVSYIIAANGNCNADTSVASFVIDTTGKWTGTINSDWNQPGNWVCNIIPDSTTNVTIPGNAVNFPFINTGTGAVKNLTIQNPGSLNITNAILQIAGSINNTGTFTATNGQIEMNGLLAQTIPTAMFTGNTIKELIINNLSGVSLGGALNITGKLTVSGGFINTGGYLTLKSSDTATASVAPVTSFAATPINGNVTVERYIPGRRKYRIITSSVTTSETTTLAPGEENLSIWGNWQNAGNNTMANTGTLITGGTSTNGFDAQTGNPSLFTYDDVTRLFTAFSTANGKNTKYTSLKAGVPYYMFVYGDRLNTVFTLNPNNTVLKESGTLLSGDQIYNSSSAIPLSGVTGRFTMLGNPFASAIDWATLSKTGISSSYWGWDPNLSSTGGYVTVTSAGDITIISPFSGSTGLNQYIQPGQGFFVQTIATSPALIIGEEDKSGNFNAHSFRTGMTSGVSRSVPLLAINLQYSNGSSMVLADGVVAAFDTRFSSTINDEDAVKMTNANETLAIVHGTEMLSIDARPAPVSNDTIFLGMGRLTKSQYVLQVFAQQMDTLLTQPYLQDNYLNTKQALSLSDTNRIPFMVDGSKPLSYAANRFNIVFNMKNRVPITIVPVDAIKEVMRVVPNPVTGRQMNVSINDMDKGAYSLMLVNANGQQVMKKTVNHDGGNFKQTFALNPKLTAGVYYLYLRSKSDKHIKKIFIE